jgi:hypothetical protein
VQFGSKLPYSKSKLVCVHTCASSGSEWNAAQELSIIKNSTFKKLGAETVRISFLVKYIGYLLGNLPERAFLFAYTKSN